MQSAERRDRDRFLTRVRADQKARSEKGPSAVQQDPSIGRRGETTRKSTCVFGARAHARIPSLTRSYTGEITGKVKLKPLDVDAERRAYRYQDKLHADLFAQKHYREIVPSHPLYKYKSSQGQADGVGESALTSNSVLRGRTQAI